MIKLFSGFEKQKHYQRLLQFQELFLGFWIRFLPFFDTFDPFSPKILKMPPKPSAWKVLSETVLDFFLLQIEQ